MISTRSRLSLRFSSRIPGRGIVTFVLLAALSAAAMARTAPRVLPLAAPVLQSFDGRVHTDTYVLKVSIDSTRVNSWVRILRDGVQIDSISGTTSKTFSRTVPLLVGTNTFTAVLRDSASVPNVSPPSNPVIVRFDGKAGFFMPVPMVPNASFDINTVNPAAKVELRIFDTVGDLVIRFESREPDTSYSFRWDGENGSDQSVRRGPLVAVAAIDYPDGTHEIIRQVFLFDPRGAP